MKWKLVRARTAFEAHRALWDDLNRRTSDTVLLDSRFVAPLLQYFGSGDIYLAVHEDPSQPALALVERTRVGAWHTFQPSQSPLGLILMAEPRNAAALMGSLVRSLPGLVLECSVLQQDPSTSAFSSVQESGSIAIQKYIDTAKITVQGTFQEYWSSRDRGVVEDVTRKIRRLDRDGIRLDLHVVRDPALIGEAIREYGRLESTGWKGKAGTAVEGDNDQGLFYRDALIAFCQDGHGAIYQLQFDGKTVASKITVHRNGTMVFLKTAYDEVYRSHYPGYLLQYKLLESIYDEGAIRSVEFYGRVRAGWTDRWSNEVRSMFHVTFYRHAWVRWALTSLKTMRSVRTIQSTSESVSA
jgi:hypothetical protein